MEAFLRTGVFPHDWFVVFCHPFLGLAFSLVIQPMFRRVSFSRTREGFCSVGVTVVEWIGLWSRWLSPRPEARWWVGWRETASLHREAAMVVTKVSGLCGPRWRV